MNVPVSGGGPRSIFLYNPISRQGHLDSYARLYARALVELGHRVVLVSETDAGAPAQLALLGQELAERLRFVSFERAEAAIAPPAPLAEPSRAHLAAHARAALVWQAEGIPGLARRLVRVPLRLARALLPAAFADAWQRLARRLAPNRGRPSFASMLCRIAGAAKLTNLSPDLALILYLDMMSEQRRDVGLLDDAAAAPWAGILFHPRGGAAGERYFGAASARGAIFLVPSAVPDYARRHPRLRFVVAPDVADLELAPHPHPLAAAMRARAGGRRIVLVIGTIAPHKGIDTLLAVIGAADPARFFFALVGAVHWQRFGAFGPELRAFYQAPPGNVLVHDGYVEDEAGYNSLIAASDIVYAVYRDFDSSSNSLTKAAGFARPILVASGTLMGRRVEEAGIGAAAPAGDVGAILAGLSGLADAAPGAFDFDRFSNRHSLAELKLVLAQALGQWRAVPSAVPSAGPSAGP